MKVRPYIFYFQNDYTGNCMYVDGGGNIQEISIMAAGTAQDVSLKNAPGGWMEATLGYARNKTYYGFNRSYSDPIKMVKDAAFMARTKFYLGQGIETKISLLILKWNPNPAIGEGNYKLYYKAPIDFPQSNDIIAEGFECNLLEGGILQMLKTYENTVFSIPCDGSIPENIKVNMDGMLLQDTLNYAIPSFSQETDIFWSQLPCNFVDNDGDSIGMIHQDQTSALPYGNSTWYRNNQNYMLSFQKATTVTITGSITVQSIDQKTVAPLILKVITGTQATIADDSYELLPQSTTGGYTHLVTSPRTYYFTKQIPLKANETFFLIYTNAPAAGQVALQFLGGNFSVTFASSAADTAPWCITWYDLFKLLIKNINQAASNQFQTFNFGADSQLLQQKLNLTVTSGDALRASGDPNYQKFYNAIQANPNFPNVNNTYSFGPVIKTSLSAMFQSYNAVLNGALGNQTLSGEGETVFFENKGYVYNSSQDTFDLGEVSDMKRRVDVEKLFTILQIGYEENQYDQKSGKYEWNTTLEMVSPINSIPSKILRIVSPYRADAYGIERLRANIDATSSTKNSSDNSVFIINTDPTTFIYDYFEMNFTSSFPDPTNSNNTNMPLVQNNLYQTLPLVVLRSAYFSVNNDPSIMVLSQQALSASMPLAINITGNLNGAPINLLTGQPADFVTINLFVNGAIVKTWTVTSTSPSTVINITDSYTKTWHTGDNMYFQASTSATGTAQIDSIGLNMNSGYFTSTGANITVEGGASNRMLAMPTVGAPLVGGLPVLSFSFQYFQFNSALANKNFNTVIPFNGAMNGTLASPAVQVDLRAYSSTDPTTNVSDTYVTGASGGWQPFASAFNFNRNWSQGDIMFIVGSSYSTMQTEFEAIDIKVTSTEIKAYALKRVQYDYISGIPALCGFTTTPIMISTLFGPLTVDVPTAIPVTTGPGAPYNIEDLTPKQMLLNWGNYLNSVLWDQPNGILQFSTLSKNQYLVTRLNGVTLVQNAPVRLSDLDPGLFTLLLMSFNTRVPDTFDSVMRSSVNAFLSWTYFGKKYYGFAEDMKQKSTLNEMQQWEALVA